ncbi:MAG: PIG-L family deacetylase [Chloroflexota bacterium]|nr:PIG-L family deacetylase [Chloroflexota bacterium]
MDGYAQLYLSPHLDDAVFSCAGRIWRGTQAGERVAVVTVFAGCPGSGAPLSPYARQLHARWDQPVEAARRRQMEDVMALALLGAEPMHWPYLDCIYRRTPEGEFPYASQDALWGQIHPACVDMVEQLAQRMRVLPLTSGGRLYVPLGVGGHVDHRIVRRAAEASGHPLTYYEDFPYARDPQALEAALTHGRWQPECVPLSRRALEVKAAAIACYASQISTFWGSRDAMGAAVRAFAERTGGGDPAERYWRCVGP